MQTKKAKHVVMKTYIVREVGPRKKLRLEPQANEINTSPSSSRTSSSSSTSGTSPGGKRTSSEPAAEERRVTARPLQRNRSLPMRWCKTSKERRLANYEAAKKYRSRVKARRERIQKAQAEEGGKGSAQAQK